MVATSTKTYHASRQSEKGEELWAIRDEASQQINWLSMAELEKLIGNDSPEKPTTLAALSEEELQSAANQYGEIQAFSMQVRANTPEQQQPQRKPQQPQQQSAQQPVANQTSSSTSAASQNAMTKQQRSNNQTNQTQNQKDDTPSDWLEHLPTAFLWLLLLLLLLGIGAAIAWNVQPFIAMTALIAGSVDQGAVESFLGKIPILGDMLLWVGGGIIVITGFVWFVISQALELSPTLMTASDKHTLRMINAITRSVGLEVHQSDHTDLVWLKNTYNNRLIASVSFFRTCRIVVLTMEAAICWITHPPVEGNPLDFILYLCTGQFDKINWGNVALTISLLFLIECLVKIGLRVLKHIHANRQIAREEQEALAS